PSGYETPLEVRKRLKELQEKAYTINDLIGKSGVEGKFDAELRGSYGKKVMEVDVKGNLIRELPGRRKAESGSRILLTISSELQEFAERLLIEQEPVRDRKDSGGEMKLDTPWIKGGAIVALDPKTGEVLALASYPRFDPNDFVPSGDPEIKNRKGRERIRWLENESYAGEIWDGKRPLEREIGKKGTEIKEESLLLSWERYLEQVLPKEGSLRKALSKIANLKSAIRVQELADKLVGLSAQDDLALLINALYEGDGHHPSKLSVTEETLEAIRVRCQEKGEEFFSHKRELDGLLSSIPHNDDKLLLLDLLTLVVKKEDFSEELLMRTGDQSLATYRALSQAALSIEAELLPYVKELYHALDFNDWRKAHFKDFLKLKRREEKQKKRYARPYTDYLDQLERLHFKDFWQKNRWLFVTIFLTGKTPSLPSSNIQAYVAQIFAQAKKQTPSHPAREQLKRLLSSWEMQEALSFLQTVHAHRELTRPLYGNYRSVRKNGGLQQEKHLASAFYPLCGFSYGRSQAFRQSSPQGSVFKLVTAYTALKERYEKSPRDLNPLTLIDDLKWDSHRNSSKQILGYTLEGQPITRLYKGGQLPRSSHSHIGKIDMVGALEQSSNLYFALLAGEHLKEPQGLATCAKLFGFGAKTGIDLPGETCGNVPDDIAFNRTSLYSFAIGQHSLVVTPLQTALMTSAIANHGSVLRPKIIKTLAGKERDTGEQDLAFDNLSFPFQDELSLVGISFPMFMETQKEPVKNFVSNTPTFVHNKLFLPDKVRDLILEGMQRAVIGARGTARAGAISSLLANQKLMRDYLDTQKHVVGKTGTAEILYKHALDRESEAEKVTHVWFTGISFDDDPGKEKWQDPELVVVVLLRFGERGGKEAAPLALQLIKKWRELKKAHQE
ncbi:MAG: penicillin-binding transpeptidase domain-containing protein, partial [Chlamydiales bacterium]